ncbi:MAG TPA: ABC transporter permease [Galbitalea sp.]|jgi:lipooligosaccharide transport system permease protein|nr:ABC transporter permease [Galbitalea sp.]
MSASSSSGAGANARRWGAIYVAEHRLRAMRAYLQTLLVTGFGNPLLYLFGLGVGLARLISANVDGATYLEFVAPALLASAAVTVASEEFSYPVLMGFKWNPIFFAMNSAPIAARQIVGGMVISVFIRMFPTVGVYYVFMLLFGAVPRVEGVFDILVAVLTGMAVGIAIMAYTSTVKDDHGQMAIIQRFILMPMFLFSGTFFPITALPIYLQWIGWISPLWHGTQLGRVLSYGMAEPAWLTAVHVAYLVLIAGVCWILAARSFAKRLNS